MLSRRHMIGASLLALTLPIQASVDAMSDAAPPHTKEPAVDPVSWGKVKGGVYDPTTRKPIAGAQVSIRADGAYATEGKTTAITDSAGYFECEAEIGRTERKTDALRVLGGIALGGTLPGTFASSNRVDIDQLTVRVTAPGYRPFEGIVRCASIHAAHYDVHTDAILLMPENMPGASVDGAGWFAARITEFRLEPAVVVPGETVQVRLRVQCPPPGQDRNGKDHRFRAQIDLPDDKRIWLEQRTDNGDGTYTFQGSFKAPKLRKNTTILIWSCSPYLEMPYAVRGIGDALLQVVPGEAGKPSANERLEAWHLMQTGDVPGAAAAFSALANSVSALILDMNLAGDLWMRAGKPEQALEFRRSRFLSDKDSASATEYLATLVALKRYDEAAREGAKALAELRSVRKDADLPKYLMGDFLFELGDAHLSAGQVAEARSILELYQKHWPGADATGAFGTRIRLAEADRRLKTAPGDASALQDRATALRDLERWEDALPAIERALAVEPRAPEMVRDRTFVRLHLPREQVSVAELDAALAAAEPLTVVADGGKTGPVAAFAPWHTLAILRLARAQAIRRGAPGVLTEAYDAAHEAFDGAIRNARFALPRRPRNAVSVFTVIQGFRVGAAASDFDARQSLLILRDLPRDAQALAECASAMADLELWSLADEVAEDAMRLSNHDLDARLVRVRAALQQERRDDAEAALRALIEKAPYHARARPLLAELIQERNPGEAQRLRAEHAERYQGVTVPVPRA